MSIANPSFTSLPYEPDYSLTGSEIWAEEMVLSWMFAPDHIGICYSDWTMSRSVQAGGKNSSEDRYIKWAEISRAVDKLRPAKYRFLMAYYWYHLPWMEICRRCHIKPSDPCSKHRKGILRLLARWLML